MSRDLSSIADDYAQGRGLAHDDKRAVALYHAAANKGDVSAQSKLGAMIANCRGTRCDDKAAVGWLKRAAEAGDASAQFNLGVMYADGRGLPSDQKSSAGWRIKAADQGLTVAMRDVGDLLTSQSKQADQDRGLSYYERLADRGDADAAYRAGHFLAWRGYCGHEQRDSYLRSAIPWLEKAAAHGDARADLDLAHIYEDFTAAVHDTRKSSAWYERYWSTKPVPPARRQDRPAEIPSEYERTQRVILDANQTFDWYTRAAARGDAVAAYNVGLMYLSGLGVDINDVEAKTWLLKASSHGVGEADAVLGDIYDAGRDGERKKAIAFYERATQKGVVRAQIKLGKRLGFEGFRWFLAAARRGSVEAARRVGEAYADSDDCEDRGRKPACDPILAMKWFRVAADGGDVVAQFELAEWTEGASNSDPGRNPAIALFLRASDNGSGDAAEALERIYNYGHGSDDQRKALRFFLLAAERDKHVSGDIAKLYEALGEPQQAFDWYRKNDDAVKVGLFYENGVGVAKDLEKARQWYLKGAQNGLPQGQYRLGRLYADGLGVDADAVLAYELFALSSMGGSEGAARLGYDKSQPQDAAEARAALALRMTPSQIAAATTSASKTRRMKRERDCSS